MGPVGCNGKEHLVSGDGVCVIPPSKKDSSILLLGKIALRVFAVADCVLQRIGSA